ncbi:hypothetical protein [Bacillus paranthracis]|uniref:hypothetical protein n=1 Tax=Bacillus paranthracis TaxID=2026186 RepID=UPI00355869F2
MIVYGTVQIDYSVDINVKSIMVEDMSIAESNELIREAIAEKYGVHASNIYVKGMKKEEE